LARSYRQRQADAEPAVHELGGLAIEGPGPLVDLVLRVDGEAGAEIAGEKLPRRPSPAACDPG